MNLCLLKAKKNGNVIISCFVMAFIFVSNNFWNKFGTTHVSTINRYDQKLGQFQLSINDAYYFKIYRKPRALKWQSRSWMNIYKKNEGDINTNILTNIIPGMRILLLRSLPPFPSIGNWNVSRYLKCQK